MACHNRLLGGYAHERMPAVHPEDSGDAPTPLIRHRKHGDRRNDGQAERAGTVQLRSRADGGLRCWGAEIAVAAPAPEEADAGRPAHLVRRGHEPVRAQRTHVDGHVRHALARIYQQLAADLHHTRSARCDRIHWKLRELQRPSQGANRTLVQCHFCKGERTRHKHTYIHTARLTEPLDTRHNQR